MTTGAELCAPTPGALASTAEFCDACGEIANILGGNVDGPQPGPSVLSVPQVAIDARQVLMTGATVRPRADLLWDGEPGTVAVRAATPTNYGGMSCGSWSPTTRR